MANQRDVEVHNKYISEAILHKLKSDMKKRLMEEAEKVVDQAIEDIAGEMYLEANSYLDLGDRATKVFIDVDDRRDKKCGNQVKHI